MRSHDADVTTAVVFTAMCAYYAMVRSVMVVIYTIGALRRKSADHTMLGDSQQCREPRLTDVAPARPSPGLDSLRRCVLQASNQGYADIQVTNARNTVRSIYYARYIGATFRCRPGRKYPTLGQAACS